MKNGVFESRQDAVTWVRVKAATQCVRERFRIRVQEYLRAYDARATEDNERRKWNDNAVRAAQGQTLFTNKDAPPYGGEAEGWEWRQTVDAERRSDGTLQLNTPMAWILPRRPLAKLEGAGTMCHACYLLGAEHDAGANDKSIRPGLRPVPILSRDDIPGVAERRFGGEVAWHHAKSPIAPHREHEILPALSEARARVEEDLKISPEAFAVDALRGAWRASREVASQHPDLNRVFQTLRGKSTFPQTVDAERTFDITVESVLRFREAVALAQDAIAVAEVAALMDSDHQAPPEKWTQRTARTLEGLLAFYGTGIDRHGVGNAVGMVCAVLRFNGPVDVPEKFGEITAAVKRAAAALEGAIKAGEATSNTVAEPKPVSPKLPKTRRGLQRFAETTTKDQPIVAALREGKSYRIVANECGVGKSTVARVARANGLTGHAPESVPLRGTLDENLSIRGKPRNRRAK